MSKAFILLVGLLLLCQQAFPQKIVPLHTFELPDSQSGYLFAGDNFYLNKDTYFDVLNLSSGKSARVNKPSQQQLQTGSTLGALGSSALFSALDNQKIYVADYMASEEMSGPTNSQQIVTGKSAAYMLYLLAGEGYKMIAIDNQTRKPVKFWITGEQADVQMAYSEKEDLLYFSNKTAPNTVALYVSDGTTAGTTLLKEVEESAEETLYHSFFLNNGTAMYLVNFTYQKTAPLQYLTHIYQLSANAVTDAGTYMDLKQYARQNFIQNNTLYGYNVKTQSIVKAESETGGYTSLLASTEFVTFEGAFQSKVLFTVRSDESLPGDSLVTLYETNGTAAGTRVISDRVDAFFNEGRTIAVHNGVLYFIRRDARLGAEVFQYDGDRVNLVEDAVPGLSGLQHVHFYTDARALYFTAQPSDNLEQLTVYKLTDNASTIQLSTYADLNGNGVKEADEPYLPNQQYALNEDGLTVMTYQDVTNVNLQEGSYTLSIKPASGWAAADKSSTSLSMPEDNGRSYSFGLTPVQQSTKVDASVMSGATRCGFPTPFTVHYSNSGFTRAKGTIKVKPAATFAYTSAAPAPSRFSGDTLVWDIDTLEMGMKGKILINFTMPGVEHMGDTLLSTLLTSFKAANNETTHASTTTLQQILTCSFDPNDIQANPAGFGEQHLTLKDQELEYLIRFQNMGTDKAFNIVVQNELQPGFDLATFKVVGSSHDMYTTLKGNQISFHFNNILLPDDKTDEPGSHGYILYRITPKAGLADSTVLQNQASIYFDYNPAIETNVALNTLVDELPVKSVLTSSKAHLPVNMRIYPNPATQTLTVACTGSNCIYSAVSLFNAKGQQVLQAQLHLSSPHQLDVSRLPRGLYLLRITQPGKIITRRVVLH